MILIYSFRDKLLEQLPQGSNIFQVIHLDSRSLIQRDSGPMVFELTVGTSPVNFVKKIQQKMCSKLIGVASKLQSKFYIFNLVIFSFPLYTCQFYNCDKRNRQQDSDNHRNKYMYNHSSSNIR